MTVIDTNSNCIGSIDVLRARGLPRLATDTGSSIRNGG